MRPLISFILFIVLAAMQSPTKGAETVSTLIITGGHDFNQRAFFKMFEEMPGIRFVSASHSRTNASAYDREDLFNYDVVVLYDMPNVINEAQKKRFLELFNRSIGLVVLHHALVSFQQWPEYERIIGGRYPEPEGKSGKVTAEVGYQHDVEVPVIVALPEHAVTAGLKNFIIHDEIYWGYRVAPDVTPLLTTSHSKSGKTLAWTRTEKKSRIVFIQPGHGPTAYDNPHYRQLLAQSIKWVAQRQPR